MSDKDMPVTVGFVGVGVGLVGVCEGLVHVGVGLVHVGVATMPAMLALVWFGHVWFSLV